MALTVGKPDVPATSAAELSFGESSGGGGGGGRQLSKLVGGLLVVSATGNNTGGGGGGGSRYDPPSKGAQTFIYKETMRLLKRNLLSENI